MAGAEAHLTGHPVPPLTIVRQATVILIATAAVIQTAEAPPIRAERAIVTATPTAGLTEHQTVFHKETATVIPKAHLYQILTGLHRAAVRPHQAQLRYHREYLTVLLTARPFHRPKGLRRADQALSVTVSRTAHPKVFLKTCHIVRAAEYRFRTATEHHFRAVIRTEHHIQAV